MSNDPGTLIHYGDSAYDPKKFDPVTNMMWIKPKGGLWTSPVDTEWGWKHWCEAENFRECLESNSFKIRLTKTARVLKIDGRNDIDNLPKAYVPKEMRSIVFAIDFVKLSKDFDAMWLTRKGENETRFGFPRSLYGWDCESVLILNKRCIIY